MLVMGTKEKNAAVKSYSEHALISLLRLRQDNSTLTVCLSTITTLGVDIVIIIIIIVVVIVEFLVHDLQKRPMAHYNSS